MRGAMWRSLLCGAVVASAVLGHAEDPFATNAPTAKRSGGKHVGKSVEVPTLSAEPALPPLSADVLAAAERLAKPGQETVAPAATVSASAGDAPTVAAELGDTQSAVIAPASVIKSPASAQPPMTTLWLRAGAAFVFVVTLVLMTAALAKKALAKSGMVTRNGTALLQVLQTMSLGTTQKLAVVQFDQQKLLIGMTNQQMQVLSTIPLDGAAPIARPAAPETAAADAWAASTGIDYTIPAQAPTLDQRIAAGSDIPAAGGAQPHDLLEQVRGTIRALKPLSWRGRKGGTA